MSDNTPPPTVQRLLEELNEVDDWYTLGVALGVHVRKLREIQASNSQGGVQRWKIDMFQSWLDSTPTASWEDVIRTLERLDHVTLATNLRSKYLSEAGVQQSPATETATGSSVRPSTGTTGAEIQAKMEDGRLIQLQDLESYFSSMLKFIKRVYANCNLAEVRSFLSGLLETEEFKSCPTFDAILHQLCRGHVDTFNVHFLEQFAAHFNRDEVDAQIDEYNKNKEAFLNQTVVAEFHRVVASRPVPDQPEEKAAITIEIAQLLASQKTLKHMDRLASKAFGDHYNYFIKLHARPGPIIITWFFPKSLTDELRQLVEKHKALFKKEGVEEVTVAGRVAFNADVEERADQIIAQGQEVKQQIDRATEQAINTLKESRNQLKEKVKAVVQQKLQALSQQREETTSSELQPVEEADITFTINEEMAEYSKLGEVNFSLSITSQVVAEGEGIKTALTGQEASFKLTTSSPAALSDLLPIDLLSCQLTAHNSSQPVECVITPTQSGNCIVKFTPTVRGPHQMKITVGGSDIPNTPFTVCVFPSLDRPLQTITGVNTPCSVAVSESGEVVVSECKSEHISVFSREGVKIRSFEPPGRGRYEWYGGHTAIAFTRDGHLLVLHSLYHQLHKFTLEGKLVKSVGEEGDGPLQFNYPNGIAIHQPSGSVFVADSGNHRIQVLNSNFSFSHTFGKLGLEPGQFKNPCDVAINSQGEVYVIDNYLRVQKFTFSGHFSSSFSSVGSPYPSAKAIFSSKGTLSTFPKAICIDSTDMVYVSYDSHCKAYTNEFRELHIAEMIFHEARVLVYNTQGQLLQVLGTLKMGQNPYPLEMAVDKDDNLYVCNDKYKCVHIY